MVIALADASKLGNETFALVADLNQIDVLITDDNADDPDILWQLRTAGLEVVVVKVAP